MKYSITVACLMALVASSRADAGYGLGVPVYAPGHASLDYYSYPKYAFEYAVKDPHTGDNKAQWEKRDGDVVKGAYSLVEPDGSVRIVEYWADDKSGFNAVVKRVGPNLHPVHVPAAPIYKAPIPVLSHEHGYGHGPISIGSVAQYSGLAHAPLLTGPVHGGAYSSASLIKSEPVILKAPAPIISKPIIPVIKEAQILSEPYYNDLAYKAGPIIETPVYKNDLAYKAGPIIETPVYKNDLAYKAGPIIETPIYKNDLAYKAGPIIETPVYKNEHAYSAPLAYDHGYAAPQPIKYQYQPIIKAPYQDYQSLAHLGQGLLKQNIGYDYGYLEKGPLLSGWGGYDLGLKH